MTLYRLEVSPELDHAELYSYTTDELLASGTPEEVKEALERRLREEAYAGTISALNRR
jgi:hypothetical protein